MMFVALVENVNHKPPVLFVRTLLEQLLNTSEPICSFRTPLIIQLHVREMCMVCVALVENVSPFAREEIHRTALFVWSLFTLPLMISSTDCAIRHLFEFSPGRISNYYWFISLM